jgi:hypothetical protein
MKSLSLLSFAAARQSLFDPSKVFAAAKQTSKVLRPCCSKTGYAFETSEVSARAALYRPTNRSDHELFCDR